MSPKSPPAIKKSGRKPAPPKPAKPIQIRAVAAKAATKPTASKKPGKNISLQAATRIREEDLTPELSAVVLIRVLADPHRFRLLKMIAAHAPEGIPCSTLCNALNLTPSTLSHHMRSLRQACFVNEERNGRTVLYTLHPETLKVFLSVLRSHFRRPRR